MIAAALALAPLAGGIVIGITDDRQEQWTLLAARDEGGRATLAKMPSGAWIAEEEGWRGISWNPQTRTLSAHPEPKHAMIPAGPSGWEWRLTGYRPQAITFLLTPSLGVEDPRRAYALGDLPLPDADRARQEAQRLLNPIPGWSFDPGWALMRIEGEWTRLMFVEDRPFTLTPDPQAKESKEAALLWRSAKGKVGGLMEVAAHKDAEIALLIGREESALHEYRDERIGRRLQRVRLRARRSVAVSRFDGAEMAEKAASLPDLGR